MKYIFQIIIFFITLPMLISQEIINTEYISSDNGVFVDPETIIEEDGKFYIPISDYRSGGEFDGIVIDTFFEPLVYNYSNPDNTLLLEYTPGLGFTDYTLLKYSGTSDLSICGNNIGSCENSRFYTAIGDSLIIAVGDTLGSHVYDSVPLPPDYGDPLRAYFAVFTKDEEVLFSTTSQGVDQPWIAIDDTFAYVIYEPVSDHVFMQDSVFKRTHSTEIPWAFHKINYQTGEKVWTRKIVGYTLNEITDIKVDEEGNIVMRVEDPYQVNLGDTTILDGVFEGGAWPAQTMLKLSPDGEYIDHTPLTFIYYGPYTELRYTDYEPNGDITLYGWSQDSTGIWLEQDSFSTAGNQQRTGVVIKYDKNFNLLWFNTFVGQQYVSTRGCNNDMEGNTIISTVFSDSIKIGSEYYFNDNVATDPIPEPSKTILTKHNAEGELIGTPYLTGIAEQVREVVSIAKDHYLILYDGYTYTKIVEIKGDLFQSITAIDEMNSTNLNDMTCYPNPVNSGDYINMNIEDKFSMSTSKIVIYNMSGQLIENLSLEQLLDSTYRISTAGIAKGTYILKIDINNKIYTNQIIIN